MYSDVPTEPELRDNMSFCLARPVLQHHGLAEGRTGDDIECEQTYQAQRQSITSKAEKALTSDGRSCAYISRALASTLVDRFSKYAIGSD